jgi:hypothetical protein
MHHEDFKEDLKKFRTKSRTWAGEKSKREMYSRLKKLWSQWCQTAAWRSLLPLFAAEKFEQRSQLCDIWREGPGLPCLKPTSHTTGLELRASYWLHLLYPGWHSPFPVGLSAKSVPQPSSKFHVKLLGVSWIEQLGPYWGPREGWRGKKQQRNAAGQIPKTAWKESSSWNNL